MGFVCCYIGCFGLYDDGFSEQRRLQCLLLCGTYTSRTMEDLCTRRTCLHLNFLQDCFLLFHHLLCYLHGNSRFSSSSSTITNTDISTLNNRCWCLVYLSLLFFLLDRWWLRRTGCAMYGVSHSLKRLSHLCLRCYMVRTVTFPRRERCSSP